MLYLFKLGLKRFWAIQSSQTYLPSYKNEFNLTAQIVVRCIAKVADAYKLNKETQRKFKPLGAITYDSRILSWKTNKQFVSIWTINGRLKIPYVCGDRQKNFLISSRGKQTLF